MNIDLSFWMLEQFGDQSNYSTFNNYLDEANFE